MIVLSLFDYTTNMVKPWAEAGHECWCIDLQHDGYRCVNGVNVRNRDVVAMQPGEVPRPDILFAFPPCTDVAVSGARWFKDKGLGALINALRCFDAAVRLADWYRCSYMLENPVSTVSSYWRKPDYTFHPWQYGDNYTKKTCLWTGNGFVMPEPTVTERPADCDTKRIHFASPGEERANFRSETPMGFARAVFEANSKVFA